MFFFFTTGDGRRKSGFSVYGATFFGTSAGICPSGVTEDVTFFVTGVARAFLGTLFLGVDFFFGVVITKILVGL